MTTARRRTSSLLIVVFAAMGFQVGAWALSLPPVVARLEMSVGQLGFMLAVMAGAGVAATLAAGRITERITVRRALALAAAWSGVGYAVLPVLSSFPAFTVGAMVTGVGLGLYDVAANAAGSLEEVGSGRSLLPMLHAVFSFAAAAAALLAFLVNGAQDFAPGFWLAGAICLAGAGAALLLPERVRAGPAEASAEPSGADLTGIATVAVVLAFVIVCGSFAVDATMEGFSALFIQQLPLQGPAQSAIGLAALYLAAALGRSFTSPLIRRLGDWRTLLIGLGLAVAGILVLIVEGSSWGSAVGMLLIGMGLAPAAPIGYSVMGRSRATGVERATARLTTAGYGSFILAPLLVGVIGRESLADAFRLVPGLLAVMLVVTVWFGFRHSARVRQRRSGVGPLAEDDVDERVQ